MVNKFWKDIGSNYNKAGRYYHNLLHLDSLVDQLLPVKDQIEDWQTIILSVAYHDIIYNTLKQDNEEKSASFASNRLSELGLPATQIEKLQTTNSFNKRAPGF